MLSMEEPALGPEGDFGFRRMVTPNVLTPLTDPMREAEVPITSVQNAIATSGSAELRWICAAAMFGAPVKGRCPKAERAATREAANIRESGMRFYGHAQSIRFSICSGRMQEGR